MYFYFKKMKDTKYVFFLEKRKKKQDINVVLLIKMYNNFVNFLCPWRSVDTVGIRGDEDGGRNLPAGMGMEEEMSPKRGMRQGVVKYPPLNPRPVDIPI
jgi:hypothetical protein